MPDISLSQFAGVRAALAQRVADARFLSFGRGSSAPHEDDGDMCASNQGFETAPAVFHLSYDGPTGFSERVVRVNRVRVSDSGALILQGVCHLRSANRSFSVERIVDMFDAATGEVIRDPREYLANHPLFDGRANPLGTALQLVRHEINLLTVVGAADGLFDPEEQDVLLVHLFNRCDHLDLNEQAVRQALAQIAPDQDSFASSLRQMRRGAGDASALKRTLRKLVDADGLIAPEEIVFVSEIERILT